MYLRHQHLRDVIAVPAWNWLFLGLLGVMSLLDWLRTLLPPSLQSNLRFAPHLSWQWWSTLLLVALLGVLFEASYRQVKRRQEVLDALFNDTDHALIPKMRGELGVDGNRVARRLKIWIEFTNQSQVTLAVWLVKIGGEINGNQIDINKPPAPPAIVRASSWVDIPIFEIDSPSTVSVAGQILYVVRYGPRMDVPVTERVQSLHFEWDPTKSDLTAQASLFCEERRL